MSKDSTTPATEESKVIGAVQDLGADLVDVLDAIHMALGKINDRLSEMKTHMDLTTAIAVTERLGSSSETLKALLDAKPTTGQHKPLRLGVEEEDDNSEADESEKKTSSKPKPTSKKNSKKSKDSKTASEGLNKTEKSEKETSESDFDYHS